MNSYTFNDISKSSDRYKLYVLTCLPGKLPESISFIQSQNISVINIGKEISTFISGLKDYSYLNMDVFDFTTKLLEDQKTKIDGIGNDLVAIYNLGILLEPALELKAVQLIKEFSKSSAIIIIWENKLELPDVLNWSAQQKTYSFDFTDTQLKSLQNAI